MIARTALAIVVAAAAPIASQDGVFRSVTESVAVDVSVQQQGRPVTNLRPADFQVRDNGVVQPLLDVSHEALPIDLTLVIDTSGSVQGATLASLRRAIDAVGGQLRPADRVKIVTFNQRTIEAAGFTQGRLPEMPAALLAPSGQTSVFDAMALSVIAPAEQGRRRMAIVFTDGADTVSFLSEAEILETTSRSGAAVFVVAVAANVAVLAQPATHQLLFQRITEATGGVLQVLRPSQDLGPAFVRAFNDFRASYVLRYVVQGQGKAGWHALDVRVMRPGNYDVRARRGYFSGT
jgi:Ca-activated chloride channel homolog